MKKVLVRWNKPHVMSVASGRADGSIIPIKPGINELSEADFKKISEHPTVKERMEAEVVDKVRGKVKMLEVIGAEKETKDNKGGDDEPKGLADLNANDATALIKETYDVELLRKWQDEETRKGPSKAIESQLKAIEDERNKKDEDEDSQE